MEISVDDVVYIRSDAAGRDSGKSDRLSKTFKVASAALVGGACGAVPVVGFVPTALAGLTMQDDSPVIVGLGGALLNIAGTVGWHLTKDPLFMVAPASDRSARLGAENLRGILVGPLLDVYGDGSGKGAVSCPARHRRG